MKRAAGVKSAWEVLFVYWIYICITTYEVCSCCVSSGRVVSACYGKQGEVSNVMAWNPQTNIINQGKKKCWSYESVNEKRQSHWCLLNHEVYNSWS